MRKNDKEILTVREACRRRMLLDGADAQGLEHALTITERERDDAAATRESWRRSCLAWQDWADELLTDLGRQPIGGKHGDRCAREIIGQLAYAVSPVQRCSCCGCFSTRHVVDDEELRECVDCECKQYECGQP